MIRKEEVYKIGKIGRPHGIKGEVQLQFDDDVFDRVEAEYLILEVDGILVPFFMEEYRFKSDSVALVKFCDIETQERARELTGCEVYFPHDMSDDDEDELHYSELVGYTVLNDADDKAVGVIAFVDQQTLNIMFELEDETLLPASEELITDIDRDNKTITLIIPEGLV